MKGEKWYAIVGLVIIVCAIFVAVGCVLSEPRNIAPQAVDDAQHFACDNGVLLYVGRVSQSEIRIICRADDATPEPLTVTPTPTATPTPPPTPLPISDTYYVAPGGSDSSDGAEAQPFRTIARGVNALEAGDTLYIRDGVYYEAFTITVNNVTIAAYPGEYPVIDAQDILPGDYYDILIILSGDHIVLSGLEIRNVFGTAVQMRGDYGIVRSNRIHHCENKAVLIGGTGYCDGGVTNTGNLVEDNEIWMTSLIHEGIQYGGRWAGAISAARCPSHTTIRGNTVYETWGIGIQVYEGYDTIIEDNITWDNQLEHFYVNNAPRTLVQRNIAYNTEDNIFLYKNAPSTTYAFCDETAFPVTEDVTIINNLSLGGNRGFYFYNQQAGSGLKNFLIANNTFAYSEITSIQINDGDHSSTRVYNNIFLEDGRLAIVAQVNGIDFNFNLWSSNPPSNVVSDNDVIGDPELTGGPSGAGELSATWFVPSQDSPAIDAGFEIAEVGADYNRIPRPQGTAYDIGAHEQ